MTTKIEKVLPDRDQAINPFTPQLPWLTVTLPGRRGEAPARARGSMGGRGCRETRRVRLFSYPGPTRPGLDYRLSESAAALAKARISGSMTQMISAVIMMANLTRKVGNWRLYRDSGAGFKS